MLDAELLAVIGCKLSLSFVVIAAIVESDCESNIILWSYRSVTLSMPPERMMIEFFCFIVSDI